MKYLITYKAIITSKESEIEDGVMMNRSSSVLTSKNVDALLSCIKRSLEWDSRLEQIVISVETEEVKGDVYDDKRINR